MLPLGPWSKGAQRDIFRCVTIGGLIVLVAADWRTANRWLINDQ